MISQAGNNISGCKRRECLEEFISLLLGVGRNLWNLALALSSKGVNNHCPDTAKKRDVELSERASASPTPQELLWVLDLIGSYLLKYFKM